MAAVIIRRARDEALIDRLLEKRRARIAGSAGAAAAVHLFDAIATEFAGLRDGSGEAARIAPRGGQP